VISFLVINEIAYYRTVDVKYDYYVDPDIVRPLHLTLDLTINMKCEHLGADYIDVAGNSTDMTVRGAPLPSLPPSLAPEAFGWVYCIDAVRPCSLFTFSPVTVGLHTLADPPLSLSSSSSPSRCQAVYLKTDAAHFELTPNQKVWAKKLEHIKSIELERGVDSLQRFLNHDETEDGKVFLYFITLVVVIGVA
jgi:hypothetical protein